MLKRRKNIILYVPEHPCYCDAGKFSRTVLLTQCLFLGLLSWITPLLIFPLLALQLKAVQNKHEPEQFQNCPQDFLIVAADHQ